MIIDNRPYRPAVGAVVQNPQGLILVGKRCWHPQLWKMPQGGIKTAEPIEDALRRELKEETSITSLQIHQRASMQLTYEFEYTEANKTKKHKGQTLTWFLTSTNQTDIDPTRFVAAGEEPEFSELKWATAREILTLSHNNEIGNYVSTQRQQMYRQVFWEFGLLPRNEFAPPAQARGNSYG